MEIRNKFTGQSRVSHPDTGPSKTKQQFKEEADINVITKNFLKTGIMNNVMQGEPVYADISHVNYLDMLNAVSNIDGMFNRLPARLRQQFHNSPVQMLRWTEDPKNHDQARKLGLLPQLPQVATLVDGLQMDLVKESEKGPDSGQAPKADPEAQPQHGKPAKA